MLSIPQERGSTILTSVQHLACKSVFDRAVLPSMLRWLNEAALQWMALILRRPLASLEQWKARLESHLYQMVAIVRYESHLPSERNLLALFVSHMEGRMNCSTS